MAWLSSPGQIPVLAAILIAGEDAAQVAARRADLIATLIGPQGESEMRLTRIPAGDLRADPAALIDAAKAVGFFPGPRAVLVDGATDGLTDTISGALAGWQKGDATIVVTGGDLKPKSGLRKLFESAKQAVAIILYDDPPGPEEIAALCQKAGITAVSPESRAELTDLAGGLDTGTFRRLIDTLGLFKRGDKSPLTPSGRITALAPPQIGARDGTPC